METIIMVKVGFNKHWGKKFQNIIVVMYQNVRFNGIFILISWYFIIKKYKCVHLGNIFKNFFFFFSFWQTMKKIIMVNLGIWETFGRSTIKTQWPSCLFYSNWNGLMVKAMMFYNENQGSNVIGNALWSMVYVEYMFIIYKLYIVHVSKSYNLFINKI
jgi:hypothetical protein